MWRSQDKVKEAAEALRLTAQDLKDLGVIDEIIPEPLGGAHRQPKEVMDNVRSVIALHLQKLISVEGGILRAKRREKFMAMGQGDCFLMRKKFLLLVWWYFCSCWNNFFLGWIYLDH